MGKVGTPSNFKSKKQKRWQESGAPILSSLTTASERLYPWELLEKWKVALIEKSQKQKPRKTHITIPSL